MGRERTLSLHNGVDSVHSACEGNEERITLGAYHAPIVCFACLAQELIVLREQCRIFLA
jgi:hypothetical protein